jgi:hypothetical protein
MASQLVDAVELLRGNVKMNYREAKDAFLQKHGAALNETTFYNAKRKVKRMASPEPPTTKVSATDAIQYLNRVDVMAKSCGGYDGLELFVRSIMEIGGPENIITVIDRIKSLR